MNSVIKSFLMAFSSYSLFPGSSAKPEKENTRFILLFVPIIGAIIGVILYFWSKAWPYLCDYMILPASLCVVVPMILSGGSHLESFVKTVDALCAHKPREKKMAILADSQSGYFAIIVCISYFLLAVGIWSEMPIDGMPILAIGFVLSRALFGLSILTLKHAKESKCTVYVPDKAAKGVEIIILAVVFVVCALFMVKIDARVGCACIIGAVVAFVYYWISSYKHFGGITEDTAGYFLQICEIIIPLAALLAFRSPISSFLAYEQFM